MGGEKVDSVGWRGVVTDQRGCSSANCNVLQKITTECSFGQSHMSIRVMALLFSNAIDHRLPGYSIFLKAPWKSPGAQMSGPYLLVGTSCTAQQLAG